MLSWRGSEGEAVWDGGGRMALLLADGKRRAEEEDAREAALARRYAERKGVDAITSAMVSGIWAEGEIGERRIGQVLR